MNISGTWQVCLLTELSVHIGQKRRDGDHCWSPTQSDPFNMIQNLIKMLIESKEAAGLEPAQHRSMRARPDLSIAFSGHRGGCWGQLAAMSDIDTGQAACLGVECDCWTVIRQTQPPSLIRFLTGCKMSRNQLWQLVQVSTQTWCFLGDTKRGYICLFKVFIQ